MKYQDDLLKDYRLPEDELARLAKEAELNAGEQTQLLQAVRQKCALTAEPMPAVQQGPAAEKRRRGRRRSWVAALVALLVLAAAGLAVAGVVLDGDLAAFWQADQQQSALLGESGAVLDCQVTDQGTTVAVQQAVGDAHNVYVLFEVIAPPGTVLAAESYQFAQAFVRINAPTAMGYHFEQLADDDPADNRLTMLLLLDANQRLAGETMTLELSDLSTYDAATDSEQIVAPGQWTLKFALNYDSLSSAYAIKNQLVLYDQVADCKYTLQKMELSPLSATLIFSRWFPWGDQSQWLSDEAGLEALAITLDDGSTVGVLSGGGSTNLTKMVRSYQFERMIDPARIVKIEFMGQELQY